MGLMTSDQIDEMYDTAYKVGYEQGVKDFAERLKPKVDCEYGNKFYRDKCFEEIDNLVKEMTEDNK